MFKLFRYLKNFKVQAIVAPFFKWLEAVFELIVPFLMAKIIDIGITNNDFSYIYKMGAVIIALGFAGYGFSLICQTLATKTAQGVGFAMRRDLYDKIMTFSYADLDYFGAPTLVTRITNDIQQVSWAIAMMIRLVMRAPFLIIGATIMAMIINFKISLIFIATAVIISIIYYLIMTKTVPYFKSIQKKLDNLGQLTRENLTGARVVRAFSRKDYETQKFYKKATEHAETSIQASKLSSLLNPLTYALFNLAIVAIIILGGIQVNIGELTQGKIIALVNYLTQISVALFSVANLIIVFTKASASASRINEIFENEISDTELNNKKQIKPIENDIKISIKSVSYTYNNDALPSLQNINIDMKNGETIGIIGVTGSGKTTLINLLPRFYDVTDGEILIDGVNIKNYPISQLRQKFGIASQHATLFHGTILDNLKANKSDADINEINKALDIACAKDFVYNKPNNINEIITQGGKNLSGGQRQRLCIARAVIKNPEILIFDDCFSALDYQTDLKVRQNIHKNFDNITTILVSQRISTLLHADKIIVMDKGKVIDIGTHKNLLNTCKPYKNLYDLQTSEVCYE